jgi:hypothetical protein
VSKRRSPLVFITKVRQKRAGILQRRGPPDAMFREPIEIGSGNRARRLCDGLEHDDRISCESLFFASPTPWALMLLIYPLSTAPNTALTRPDLRAGLLRE